MGHVDGKQHLAFVRLQLLQLPQLRLRHLLLGAVLIYHCGLQSCQKAAVACRLQGIHTGQAWEQLVTSFAQRLSSDRHFQKDVQTCSNLEGQLESALAAMAKAADHSMHADTRAVFWWLSLCCEQAIQNSGACPAAMPADLSTQSSCVLLSR